MIHSPRERFQQVIVVGLVRDTEAVLLTRASRLRDAASATGGGYFDLPRFAVPFAADPTDVLTRELRELCGVEPYDPRPIAVRQYLTAGGRQQVFEVVLAAVAPAARAPTAPGRYTFVTPDAAAELMFAEEYERLRRWLGE